MIRDYIIVHNSIYILRAVKSSTLPTAARREFPKPGKDFPNLNTHPLAHMASNPLSSSTPDYHLVGQVLRIYENILRWREFENEHS